MLREFQKHNPCNTVDTVLLNKFRKLYDRFYSLRIFDPFIIKELNFTSTK